MFEAFSEAAQFMLQRMRVLVMVLVLLGVQLGLTFFVSDVQDYILSTGDVLGIFQAFDGVQVGVFFLITLISLIISISTLFLVAQQFRAWKSKSTTSPASLQIIKSAGMVVAVLIIAMGLLGLVVWILNALADWIGFFGLLLWGIFALLLVYALFKLSFLLTFMGFGQSLRDALRSSWEFTRQHVWKVLGLLIVVFIISSAWDLLLGFVQNLIENEWIGVAVTLLMNTLITVYVSAVLAGAVPLEFQSQTFSHPHKGKAQGLSSIKN